jgi:hypothetical protein
MKAKTITMDQFQEGEENMFGYCIACGASRDGCEPDARKYPCEECGKRAVYGAQELLLMGLVTN